MKNNIVLIGMPGVGKSSAGVVLAKVLGYKFVDTDIIIQEKTGKLLKDIIQEEGVAGFIKIENEILSGVREENTVIATGGSAVFGKEAMSNLKRTGIVIYLKASFEEIDSRLGSLTGRGVVMTEGQTLKNVYDERTPLYEKYADITVDEAGRTIRETVHEMVENINNRPL